MQALRCTIFGFVLIVLGNAEVLRWSKLLPAHRIESLKKVDSKNVLYAPKDIFDNFNHTVTQAWKLFKVNFKRNFHSLDEQLTRYHIFATRLYEINAHNALFAQGQVTYEMGVNEFSDRSYHELQHHMCYKLPYNYSPSGATYVNLPNAKLPISVDWRSNGSVTAVKNQGNCGSCYAFSAVGSVESQHHMKTKNLVSLSEQQVVDCSTGFGNEGCGGGLMDNVFQYMKYAGGVHSESDYPYTSGKSGHVGVCRITKEQAIVNVSGYVDLPSGNEETLKEAVALHGPISVAMNAARLSFSSYKSGVYSDPECGGTKDDLNHGVLLVGYGEEKGVPYWLVKNSWGSLWGEQGYVKIRRDDENLCGVATAASYPLL